MNDPFWLVTFALGCGVGWTIRGWWERRSPPTREEQLIRKVYRHLDDIIGATRYENQQRTDKRFKCVEQRRWFWWLVYPRKFREWIANRLWPVAHLTHGGNPLPSARRMAKYVQISPDFRTYTIWYTSECPANHAPFIEWLTRGRPVQGGGLAQALGREWTPDLFEVERNWAAGLVRLTLNGSPKQAPVVPGRLPAAEEFDHAG